MQEHHLTVNPDERLDRVNENILLLQKKDGLTFGTDAFLLASYVRPEPSSRGIDLGSGTGILPFLLLARKKVSHMTAIELQPAFCELIAKNAEINGFDQSISLLSCDLRTLTAKDTGGEADLVLSNPPYLKTGAGKENTSEKKGLARHEIAGDIFDFCAAADRPLKYGGRFYTVYRPDRLPDLLEALRKNKLEPKRLTFVHPDQKSPPCLVLTEAQKGAKPSLIVTRPLFLYTLSSRKEKARKLTADAKKIYDTGSFAVLEG